MAEGVAAEQHHPLRYVFLCGAPGSCARFIAEVLGLHSEVAPLYEADFIPRLVDLADHLTQLSIDEVEREVLRCVSEWSCEQQRQEVAWSRHAHELVNGLTGRGLPSKPPVWASLAGFFESVFDDISSLHNGKHIVITQWASHIGIAKRLVDMFPDAKVIHCVRDTREIAGWPTDIHFTYTWAQHTKVPLWKELEQRRRWSTGASLSEWKANLSIVDCDGEPFPDLLLDLSLAEFYLDEQMFPVEVRFPRAECHSCSLSGPRHSGALDWAAHLWRTVDWGRDHPSSYLAVHSKDFVLTPRREVARIFDFLGVTDESRAMLDPRKLNTMIETMIEPCIKDYEDWLSSMGEQGLRIAAMQLQRCWYDRCERKAAHGKAKVYVDDTMLSMSAERGQPLPSPDEMEQLVPEGANLSGPIPRATRCFRPDTKLQMLSAPTHMREFREQGTKVSATIHCHVAPTPSSCSMEDAFANEQVSDPSLGRVGDSIVAQRSSEETAEETLAGTVSSASGGSTNEVDKQAAAGTAKPLVRVSKDNLTEATLRVLQVSTRRFVAVPFGDERAGDCLCVLSGEAKVLWHGVRPLPNILNEERVDIELGDARGRGSLARIMCGSPGTGDAEKDPRKVLVDLYGELLQPPQDVIKVVGAGGSGSATNGTFVPAGTQNAKPKYRHATGHSVIYWAQGWKMKLAEDTDDHCYVNMDSADSPLPPEGQWTAVDGEDTAPTVSRAEEHVRILCFRHFRSFREALLKDDRLQDCQQKLQECGFDIDVPTRLGGMGKLFVETYLAPKVLAALDRRSRSLLPREVVVSQAYEEIVQDVVKNQTGVRTNYVIRIEPIELSTYDLRLRVAGAAKADSELWCAEGIPMQTVLRLEPLQKQEEAGRRPNKAAEKKSGAERRDFDGDSNGHGISVAAALSEASENSIGDVDASGATTDASTDASSDTTGDERVERLASGTGKSVKQAKRRANKKLARNAADPVPACNAVMPGRMLPGLPSRRNHFVPPPPWPPPVAQYPWVTPPLPKCATPMCPFRVHSQQQFGPFCCDHCFQYRGGLHSPMCEQVPAESLGQPARSWACSTPGCPSVSASFDSALRAYRCDYCQCRSSASSASWVAPPAQGWPLETGMGQGRPDYSDALMLSTPARPDRLLDPDPGGSAIPESSLEYAKAWSPFPSR